MATRLLMTSRTLGPDASFSGPSDQHSVPPPHGRPTTRGGAHGSHGWAGARRGHVVSDDPDRHIPCGDHEVRVSVTLYSPTSDPRPSTLSAGLDFTAEAPRSPWLSRSAC